jgi:hypothetical protein
MRFTSRFFATFLLLAVFCAPISEAEQNYQKGTLLGINKKMQITPLEYVFNVVAAYYETVTYELQIKVSNEVYYSDYTPEIQPNGPLPTEWQPGRQLEVRPEKHRLYVKLSYDGDVETLIARHTKTP